MNGYHNITRQDEKKRGLTRVHPSNGGWGCTFAALVLVLLIVIYAFFPAILIPVAKPVLAIMLGG